LGCISKTLRRILLFLLFEVGAFSDVINERSGAEEEICKTEQKEWCGKSEGDVSSCGLFKIEVCYK